MSDPNDLTTRAERYFRLGLFEAAVDWWYEALAQQPNPTTRIAVYDGLGKVAIQRGHADEALSWFNKALSDADREDAETQTALAMRRAIALFRTGRRDQAFRDAQTLVETSTSLSSSRRGILLSNLAGLQMGNELYQAAINSLTKARSLFGPQEQARYGATLSTNMGLSYLQLNQRAAAREWFTQAITAARGPAILAVNGLAHIAMLDGQPDTMQHWGEAAFEGMWDGLMSFDTEELAHLADILGHMALNAQHGRLAVRLFDHAQTFYSKSNLWTRWRALNETIATAESMPHNNDRTPRTEELLRFTVLLESMAAQDIVVPHASQLADIRLFIAERIAMVLGHANPQQQLTYICRLADLGLSTVGASYTDEAALTPAARQLYEQHPIMSVRLLDRLGLPEPVLAGIRDHHERWDGTGFPDGKSGTDIALWARIFAVADGYAHHTAVKGHRHREALNTLQHQAGHAFDPQCIAALVTVFQNAETS